MAISVDLNQSNFGISFAGVYYRIVFAGLTRNVDHNLLFSVMIDLAGYATVPQDQYVKEIDFRRYHAPLAEIESQNAETFLAKCYLWVMQQPDMNSSKSI